MTPYARPRWDYEIDGVGVRKGRSVSAPITVDALGVIDAVEHLKVFRPDGGGQIVELVEPVPWVLPDESGFI